jgi:predicted lipid-binding transport protein (Tim44 family)
MTRRFGALVGVLAVSAAAGLGAQNPPPQTAPPVPKPFPQPAGSAPPAAAKPADPQTTTPPAPGAPPASTAARAAARPTEADLGVRVYQGADFIDSYDAGRGQRYFLFGTNDNYADVVAFYKQQRGGGSELFKAPPVQKFDLDVKFREDTMAFPPSVVVKDYTWNNSEGYLVIEGTRERRYKTVIQIVPAPVR